MLYSEEIFKTAFWHCSDSVVIFVLLLNQTGDHDSFDLITGTKDNWLMNNKSC
jgi:hypothetical protein